MPLRSVVLRSVLEPGFHTFLGHKVLMYNHVDFMLPVFALSIGVSNVGNLLSRQCFISACDGYLLFSLPHGRLMAVLQGLQAMGAQSPSRGWLSVVETPGCLGYATPLYNAVVNATSYSVFLKKSTDPGCHFEVLSSCIK